ncbi:MAG: nucleotidyltransferase family protein [Magnetococcales bacterium]|nr:nucleotidyltransferase family protein [Magnetococcales bacterium]
MKQARLLRLLGRSLGTTASSARAWSLLAKAGEIPWEEVVYHASRLAITPSLAVVWRRNGLWSVTPEALREYLDATIELNRERNHWILRHLETVGSALNRVGLEPLLMKGLSHLVDGLFVDRGMRLMTDLDLLIPPTRLLDAVQALKASGFSERHQETIPPGHHHYPMLARDGDLAGVELHFALLPELRGNPRLVEAILADARPVTIGTATVLQPAPWDRIVITLLHAHCRSNALLFRPHLDLLALWNRHDTPVTHQRVSQRFQTMGCPSDLWRGLIMTEQLLKVRLPFPEPRPLAHRLIVALELAWPDLWYAFLYVQAGLKPHLATPASRVRLLRLLIKPGWYRHNFSVLSTLLRDASIKTDHHA